VQQGELCTVRALRQHDSETRACVVTQEKD